MNDTSQFIRLIRIFLIFARIMVMVQMITIATGMLLGQEIMGRILQLLLWLVAVVLVSIYLRKKGGNRG